MDASTGQEILWLQGHTDEVIINSVAFRPDGKQIASSGQDGVKLWDAVHGQSPPIFRTGLAYSRDGKLAISDAVKEFTLQVAQHGDRPGYLHVQGTCRSGPPVEFSPDQKWIVSADNGVPRLGEPTGLPKVRVWNAATGQEIRSFKYFSFAISPNGKWIAFSETTGIGPKSRSVLKIYESGERPGGANPTIAPVCQHGI